MLKWRWRLFGPVGRRRWGSGLRITSDRAAWYAEIAEVDRGHHHEALYMAEQEREQAREIAAQIQAGMSVRGEDCGKNHDSGAAADLDAGS